MIAVVVQDIYGNEVATIPGKQAVQWWFRKLAKVIDWFDDKILWVGDLINYKGIQIVDKYILAEEGVINQDGLVLIKYPKVIQLFTAFSAGRAPKPNTRNVIAFYGYQCQNSVCGKVFSKEEKKKLSKDHILPKCKGGGNDWMNMTCLCLKCNTKKGSKTLEEAGMKLINQPSVPKTVLDIYGQKGNKR